MKTIKLCLSDENNLESTPLTITFFQFTKNGRGGWVEKKPLHFLSDDSWDELIVIKTIKTIKLCSRIYQKRRKISDNFWIKLVALLKASLKQRWLLTWGDLTRPGTMMNHQLASEACKLFEHKLWDDDDNNNNQHWATILCRAVRQTTMVNHRAM